MNSARRTRGDGDGAGDALVPLVCSIGTTDPWNAAGLGLDIRALAACGARAVTVVVGVSAQDRGGVRALHAIPPETIAAQFRTLDAAPVAALRIGALLDDASVRAVVAAIGRWRSRVPALPVVYDPVFAPSGGGAFASTSTIATIASELLPLVTVVTPNIDEAQRFLGHAPRAQDPQAISPAQMALWGRALVELGALGALVTGGHLASDPVDVYVAHDLAGAGSGVGELHFAAPRIAGELRGTGCLLACALAAELARGRTVPRAIETARAFVRARFATAIAIGGMNVAY